MCCTEGRVTMTAGYECTDAQTVLCGIKKKKRVPQLAKHGSTICNTVTATICALTVPRLAPERTESKQPPQFISLAAVWTPDAGYEQRRAKWMVCDFTQEAPVGPSAFVCTSYEFAHFTINIQETYSHFLTSQSGRAHDLTWRCQDVFVYNHWIIERSLKLTPLRTGSNVFGLSE